MLLQKVHEHFHKKKMSFVVDRVFDLVFGKPVTSIASMIPKIPEIQKVSTEPITNQLVKVYQYNDCNKECLEETSKLIKMAMECGDPKLSGSVQISRLQDAIDPRPYCPTPNGPLFSTDPNAPKNAFVDPVPIDKFRNQLKYGDQAGMKWLLRDFGRILLDYENGKF